MRVIETALDGVVLLEPEVFQDDRGFFFESFNEREFRRLTGFGGVMVQDNHSRSVAGVLRGLHYQEGAPQGKLVRAVAGEIFDVAVDLSSGRWVGHRLSGENRRQMWIPPGYAHGFLVTSGPAEVLYKASAYYDPASERCIRWDDARLAIDWPLAGAPILSAKDVLGAAT